MLMVIGGTQDSREILKYLSKKKTPYLVTTATSYGAGLASRSGEGEVLQGRLNISNMVSIIKEKGIKAIIDASHPFAVDVSQNALEAAQRAEIKYYRYQRPPSILPSSPFIYFAEDYDEAAEKAVELGKTIFLATGSKTIKTFTSAAEKKNRRIIVRVLPLESSLKACKEAGLSPKDIIALQDNSFEVTQALLKVNCADVLVTKDSGKTGGTRDKITAALSLGIPVVVIRQPKVVGEKVFYTLADLFEFLSQKQN